MEIYDINETNYSVVEEKEINVAGGIFRDYTGIITGLISEYSYDAVLKFIFKEFRTEGKIIDFEIQQNSYTEEEEEKFKIKFSVSLELEVENEDNIY